MHFPHIAIEIDQNDHQKCKDKLPSQEKARKSQKVQSSAALKEAQKAPSQKRCRKVLCVVWNLLWSASKACPSPSKRKFFVPSFVVLLSKELSVCGRVLVAVAAVVLAAVKQKLAQTARRSTVIEHSMFHWLQRVSALHVIVRMHYFLYTSRLGERRMQLGT